MVFKKIGEIFKKKKQEREVILEAPQEQKKRETQTQDLGFLSDFASAISQTQQSETYQPEEKTEKLRKKIDRIIERIELLERKIERIENKLGISQ